MVHLPARFFYGCCCVLILSTFGCGSSQKGGADESRLNSSEPADSSQPTDKESAKEKNPSPTTKQAYEVSAEELLDARLAPQEVADGWIRLFDGHTLFGWQVSADANFRIKDGTIVVDEGQQGLLCTSTTWGDFELTLQFNSDVKTNSGVFVRTPLVPEDPASDCYEINIAPDDNPFPTGSVVMRQKVDADAAGPQAANQWRDMKIVANGQHVTVELDGKVVCEYDDPTELEARRIGLQHNSGRVAFRDIKIRPLGMDAMIDESLSKWKKYPEMQGEFTVNGEGELHVDGGKTQLETLDRFGDFVLVSEYKIDKPNMNSGIFFRCIPGEEMMGYECQVNNDFKDESRLSPADCGTGGIFRRQDARVVAGDNGSWATVLLHANGNHFAAWVNGVQVSDWEDTRAEDVNPRRGRRDEAGTIMIQGHDPETDVLFRGMKITTIE
ncbi:DUF1080 domain-containing protein [Stieleria sp. JC731]|uniref:3-keto-disaccharide hydrolase n=1 Tax=Pirellulaceae TaxID=2691357 RepID=UPI001E65DF5E|nr:DUF1080 domain-containing protein [Stieleria sp. JC731]MCC9599605.1 DUF1080 domain-containing protein [Stieleria sp. JC731]